MKIPSKKNSLGNIQASLFELVDAMTPENRAVVGQLVQYYNNLIYAMPGNVYWMDSHCKTVGCNKNVLDMFGLKNPEEFVGLSFEEMAQMGQWNSDQSESFQCDTLSVLNTGEMRAGVEEPPIPGADGDPIYFISTRVPLFNEDDEVIGIVGISTDISDRKKTEIALQQAKEQAVVANQVKSEFLSNMRHDLRTPIANLVCLSEALQRRLGDSELIQLANYLHDSSTQLSHIVDSILELSEYDIPSIAKKKQSFDLSQLLESLVSVMKPVANNNDQLRLSCRHDDQIPTMVVGPYQALRRIIINLIDNAIKFSESGEIVVSSHCVECSGDQLRIQIKVSDQGMGIPYEKKALIFDQFTRLDPAYRGNFPGSGLGLHIVKQFVEHAGGKIDVQSVEQEGSTFCVSLPMQMAEHVDSAVKTEGSSAPLIERSVKVRVLLVEDNPISQAALKMTLQDLNCDLQMVSTGQACLEQLASTDFDIIFLDIGLPDMTGMELCQLIRAFEHEHKKHRIPVVALTAHVIDKDEKYCLLSGMQQVLRKPLSLAQASQVLAAWVDITAPA